MTLDELTVRWLRSRGADVEATARGTRVSLPADHTLADILGSQFSLEPADPTVPLPPGVEPLYAGSRITDLLAGDLEPVRGIAIVREPSSTTDTRPLFVFSFQATYTTDARAERLIRHALTLDGQPASPPVESVAPLQAPGEGLAWRAEAERLFPVALKAALDVAQADIERESRTAQHRLYRTARRLALLYGRRTATTQTEEERTAEFRRLVSEEVDRHRLRVGIEILGITVFT
jgi:hypothetical protein